MNISKKIRLARIKNGYTQESLAEAMGVSRSAVAQWESESIDTYPSEEHRRKLTKLLEIDLTEEEQEYEPSGIMALPNSGLIAKSMNAPSLGRPKKQVTPLDYAINISRFEGAFQYLVSEKRPELAEKFNRTAPLDFISEQLSFELKVLFKPLRDSELFHSFYKMTEFLEKMDFKTDNIAFIHIDALEGGLTSNEGDIEKKQYGPITYYKVNGPRQAADVVLSYFENPFMI